MDFKFVKFEVFIPEEYVDKLRDALNEIGALTIGAIMTVVCLLQGSQAIGVP